MTTQFAKHTSTPFRNSRTIRFVQVTVVAAFLLTAAAPAFAADPGASPLSALLPDAATLFGMVNTGQGDAAVQLLVAAAAQYGAWAPAPGDTPAYAPGLARNVRGQVSFVDRPPFECGDARLSRGVEGCDRDYSVDETLVRLGTSTFAEPQADGSFAPRPSVDDVLSTYVEEVAHSWQEFLFETGGLGSGPRTQVTTFEDGLYWSPGWEYQVKMYVLSLDGTWFSLSATERASFVSALCDPNGYANPANHNVPSFGAPAGWPNPQGWPTSNPTPEAHAAFCANVGGGTSW